MLRSKRHGVVSARKHRAVPRQWMGFTAAVIMCVFGANQTLFLGRSFGDVEEMIRVVTLQTAAAADGPLKRTESIDASPLVDNYHEAPPGVQSSIPWNSGAIRRHDAVGSPASTSLPAVQVLSKDAPWPFQKASDVKIYFVHVGKSGGRSLYERLFVHESREVRLDCRMFNITTQDEDDEKCFHPHEDRKTFDSLLSKRLYGHFHMSNPRYPEEQKKWLRDNTNLLLVTVRDPIDRITSSFRYHYEELIANKNFKVKKHYHRSNIGAKIYMECFDSIEALARAMDPKGRGATEFCRKLGRDLLLGRLIPTPCAHFHYHYQYYANWTWNHPTANFEKKHVAVVRTESLWSDVARIEGLLGGDPKPFLVPEAQSRVTHGSENFKLTSRLSPKGAFLLCCAIWSELQVYHDLVVAAVNLRGDEKIDSLRRMMTHCGIKDEVSSQAVTDWRWRDWYRRRCPVEDKMKQIESKF